MQRKLYTDFGLLFDSISATAFLWGYMVPILQLQFVGGFTGSVFARRMYFLSI